MNPRLFSDKYPEYTNNNLELGKEYLLNKKYEEAILHFAAALTFSQLNVFAKAVCHFMRGQCFQALQLLDDARFDYQEAIRLNRNEGEFYYQLGVITQNPCDALTYFKNAYDLDYRDPNLFYHRGLAYQRTGLIALALKDFETTLKRNSNHSLAKDKINTLFLQYPELKPKAHAIEEEQKKNIGSLASPSFKP